MSDLLAHLKIDVENLLSGNGAWKGGGGGDVFSNACKPCGMLRVNPLLTA